ncbi:hypothetical protein A3K72_03720 [Candidatus Woesearchaeota archaeon RBG_13_36_6]|nr:MAG: hypothetical protein A3K72_03720 [Candidatus Woesearchaeota archaeon RBG_13_36_6]
MNILNFSMLEIVVESETHSLRDDGFVQNIDEHSRKVYREFEGSDEGYEEWARLSPIIASGRCMFDKKGDNYTWVIFYEHYNSITDAFRRGHEETHVLHGIGQIGLLQQLLAQKGLDIDLRGYPNYEEGNRDDSELVANIGALYVLEKKGENILEIPVELSDSDLQPALILYQAAIKNRQKKILAHPDSWVYFGHNHD